MTTEMKLWVVIGILILVCLYLLWLVIDRGIEVKVLQDMYKGRINNSIEEERKAYISGALSHAEWTLEHIENKDATSVYDGEESYKSYMKKKIEEMIQQLGK